MFYLSLTMSLPCFVLYDIDKDNLRIDPIIIKAFSVADHPVDYEMSYTFERWGYKYTRNFSYLRVSIQKNEGNIMIPAQTLKIRGPIRGKGKMVVIGASGKLFSIYLISRTSFVHNPFVTVNGHKYFISSNDPYRYFPSKEHAELAVSTVPTKSAMPLQGIRYGWKVDKVDKNDEAHDLEKSSEDEVQFELKEDEDEPRPKKRAIAPPNEPIAPVTLKSSPGEDCHSCGNCLLCKRKILLMLKAETASLEEEVQKAKAERTERVKRKTEEEIERFNKKKAHLQSVLESFEKEDSDTECGDGRLRD